MEAFLLHLGTLSLGGSAVVVLLALAGKLTRYGARWRCLGWLLLCLRLVIPLPLLPQAETRAPIQVNVPTSPFVSQRPISPDVSQGMPVVEPESCGVSPSPAPAQTDNRTAIDVPLILFIAWLAGTLAVLGGNLAAHLRFLRWLRRWGTPVTDSETIDIFNRLGDQLSLNRRPRLLVCPELKTPMLAGMFRLALLLPQDTPAGEELRLALLHELTHYHRRDVWRKALALWVNALYWFDPLMWYMVRRTDRDIELACDEDVLRRLFGQDYAAYGKTVLDAMIRNKERKSI